MTQTVYIDTEVYSDVSIKSVGLDVYQRHPSTEVTIVTWRFDSDAETQCADLTCEPFPDELLLAALDDDVIFIAHNAQFDRAMFRLATGINVPIERCHCTMAQAYSHSLPGGLDGLGVALGLPFDQRKLASGAALIDLFCKPGRGGKRNMPEDYPVEWVQFLEYATQDTATMIEAHRRMPTHNYIGEHLELWFADQEINERGFMVDRQMAEAAIGILQRNGDRLNAKVAELTDGAITKGTQRERILHHLVGEDGLMMLDLKADNLKKLLKEDQAARDAGIAPLVPDAARELITLRLESGMTSGSKYETALRTMGPDDRVRYGFQYSSAGTGRHAGRGFQPHNMPRPTMDADQVLNEIVPAIKGGYLDAVVENTNEAAANAIRSLIIAKPGHELVVADWSNIEGRVLAWLAGEQWKLQAYRAQDDGTGPDSYIALYSQSLRVPPESVSKNDRQKGKVMDLSMGYGGGVGAFTSMAAVYHMDLAELGRAVPDIVEPDIWKRAEKNWERALIRGDDYMLDYVVYCSCDSLKQIYRRASPAIAQLWWDLERACKFAVDNPGTLHQVGRCRIWRNGAYLIVELPSGRRLLYAQPRVRMMAEVDEDTDEVKTRYYLSYMASKNKQWRRTRTYGGKLCLAGDTEVLTAAGWKPIIEYQPGDLLWDGAEWVYGGKLLEQGCKPVIDCCGIYMTADHEVLTNGGWQSAKTVAQGEGYNRAPVRFPAHSPLLAQRQWQNALARPVRLRKRDNRGGRGADASTRAVANVVRLPDCEPDRQEEHEARHDSAPSLRRLPEHAGALLSQKSSSLQKLRRSRNLSLRTVAARLRVFLGRHAAGVQARLGFGAQEQRSGLLQGQLCLGVAGGQLQQPPKLPARTNTRWRNDCRASISQVRDRCHDATLPAKPWLRGARIATQARRAEPVYDIENAGPRQRFTVRGAGGALIVHNCENITQAVANDVLRAALLECRRRGWPVVLHVHDEAVCETPKGTLALDDLIALMTRELPWARGLPLAAAGFVSERYKKDD